MVPKQPIKLLAAQQAPAEAGADWLVYLDAVMQELWVVLAVALFITAAGTLYWFVTPPKYETSILLRVLENDGRQPSSQSTDSLAPRESKVLATSESELLRSRKVLGPVVEEQQLQIVARPRYLPLIGSAIARYRKSLSEPTIFGHYVFGAEKIAVAAFTVPEQLEGEPFVLSVTAPNRFRISQEDAGISAAGTVGQDLRIATPHGEIDLKVSRLDGKPGAEFLLSRTPFSVALKQLERSLAVSSKPKDGGFITASLHGSDPQRTADILNAIGRHFVQENGRQRAEQAEQALAFLNKQLPEFKRNLQQAETRYGEMRSKRGSVDLREEARAALERSVQAQSRIADLQQKKQDLLTRFNPAHPSVEAVEQQLAEAERNRAAVDAKIKSLPPIEQDVVGATRDLKVNSEVYSGLLALSRQLAIVQLSKMSNAQLIDTALRPREPVGWGWMRWAALSAAVGLFLGIMLALFRRLILGRADDPEKLEHYFGVPVWATIPHSEEQKRVGPRGAGKSGSNGQLAVLTSDQEQDGVLDSLRELRSALKFTMRDADNKVVMITGPTAGVGKSFVSASLAAVLGMGGKKVLLIDADMRLGYLHQYFNVNQGPGLAEVLSGRCLPEKVLHHSVAENVDFISTGVMPERPAELLEQANLGRLLQRFSDQYDVVLIDTPPLLAFADGLAVATHASSIFAVVNANKSSVGDVEYSLKRLAKAGHEVTGLVCNEARRRSLSYRYGSAYGPYSLAPASEAKTA